MNRVVLIFAFLVLTLGATLRETVLEQQTIDLMNNIRGKTVAMLTNPTSVDGKMIPIF